MKLIEILNLNRELLIYLQKAGIRLDDVPCYHTFNTIDELTDFYTKAMQHIQDTLANGWKSKDNFNLELYRE